MAATTSDTDSGFSTINVTPPVDIVLVLLIIFMVTAKLIVSQTLPMDLPKAAQGEQQQIVFSVGIDRNGAVTVDGKSVSDRSAVLSLAVAAKKKSADVRAVIQADQNVTHGNVVRVMDELKQAGIAKIAFGVVAETGK